MSEMVERVARALCNHAGADPDQSGGTWDGGRLESPAWKSFIIDARAAIEAMRDPLPQMVERSFVSKPMPYGVIGPLVWKAMIDEALREP